MAQEYLNLEETAAMLKLTLGEVNRMREQAQLRAFRDGSNWKFKKEDVEDMLTKMIKERNSAANAGEKEDDVNELLGFGLDEENEELPTMMADTGFIDPDSELVLEDVNTFDDDEGLSLEDRPSLLEESGMLSLEKGGEDLSLEESDIRMEESDSFGLVLDDDTGTGGIGLAGEASPMLEEEDDNLVLGSSSDLNLTGESGITLAEDDGNDIISLSGDSGISLIGEGDDEDVPTLMNTGIEAEEDTDFGEPFELVAEGEDMDDLDSSSQVISIDDGDDFGGSPFGEADLGGSDFGPAPLTDDFAPIDAGPSVGDPLGASIGELSQPVATAAAPARLEATYSGGAIALMFVCLFLLTFTGMFMLDLLRNMWSWDQPVVITSPIMEAIASAIGFK